MSRAAARLAAALIMAAAAPAAAQVLPQARLYVKNNTRDTLNCRLEGAGPPRPLRLRRGQEFSDRYPETARLSLTCPRLRAAAWGPLALGARYAFVRVNGKVDLVEITPDNP